MNFKKYDWSLVLRIVLLFVTLSISAMLLSERQFTFLILAMVLVAFQVFDLYRFANKSKVDFEQFVESVHYRDFSRHFDEKNAPAAVQPMRKGFNEINSTFKLITKERETQYQYLQKILELVDTGILSYDHQAGDIMWMNEPLKKLLNIPYLKSIHSLEKRDTDLYNEITAIKPGDNKVVSITNDKSSLKVLLSATAFQTAGKVYKLIAFQNINEALDETESKAWQKLLSVMTHEIMNSVAPISSLADTLKNRLHLSLKDLNNNSGSLDDLELGIDTIKRRSEGLLKFTETYRNLNKITNPDRKKVYVRDMFENLHSLMGPTLEQKQIELDTILKDPDLTVEVDINLVEQVLINLLLNATEAVKEVPDPRIYLSAYITANNKTVIKVSDNGIGISAELMEKIFVPFFSTRKTGSGIGLSLCKQIMMLHKGNIKVQSVVGEGTAFSLHF
ncbi:MAG: HAMP domain-containing histidine kinase [Chitinophagaceae bacterium]|nr:HAMP domain-containing histidine kinase [Chitinophagaceae bacterium]